MPQITEVRVETSTRTLDVRLHINEHTFVEQNTGHLKVSAEIYGRRAGNYSIECDVTNPLGNMCACYLRLGNINTSSPWITFSGGFTDPTSRLQCSNVVNDGWSISSIAGFSPITNLFSNILWSWPSYNMNLVDDLITTVDITIDADFPIFCPEITFGTLSGFVSSSYAILGSASVVSGYCSNIINNGDYEHLSDAINFINTQLNSIPSNQVYTIRCHLKQNGVVMPGTSKAVDFKIQPDARIWAVWDNRLSGDASPNFIVHINKSPWLQKNAYAPDDAYVETTVLDPDYWFGDPWQDLLTGFSYVPWCSTNIPYFLTDAEGDAYGRGEIGIDRAINGGDTSFAISTIGGDLSSMDIPEIDLSISGVGCNAYALSKAQIIDLMANYLYTTNQTLVDDIKNNLWYWGNNPIDFFIDCYYVPFDISNFYTVNNTEMKFGSYVFSGSSFPGITETAGDRLELFSLSFEGVYHDWRDYTQFDYELYLPFVGFTKLDPQKYVDRLVKCEMSFDLTTHNVRYYLYADGIVTDRIDGSVGVNIPLMASDMVNKAKNDRQAVQGAVSGALSTIGSAMTGNFVGGIGNIINTMSSLEKLNNRATESIEGGFSSSMNIYDVRYAYLKITEKQLLIPNQTTALYNYPSYYMGPVSSLSGYCELVNIRFSSTATQPEIEEIESLLRNGVIL